MDSLLGDGADVYASLASYWEQPEELAKLTQQQKECLALRRLELKHALDTATAYLDTSRKRVAPLLPKAGPRAAEAGQEDINRVSKEIGTLQAHRDALKRLVNHNRNGVFLADVQPLTKTINEKQKDGAEEEEEAKEEDTVVDTDKNQPKPKKKKKKKKKK